MSSKEVGILAIFDHPDDLIHAIKKVRHLGLRKVDVFSPFPVHGVDAALGLKRSWIPWATLALGLMGWCLGGYFQYWTMAIDWPVNVGGKPDFAWPAYVPIMFESMVLIAGVLTTFILFGVCRLPNPFQKIFDPSLTCDRFGLFVEKGDPLFNEAELHRIFKECDAENVREIH